MSSFEDQVKQLDIRGILITSNITAFGIAVALMWKDTLTEVLAGVLPHGGGVLSLFATSVVGTALLVSVAYVLLRSKDIKREHIYSFRENLKIRAYRSEMLRKFNEAVTPKNSFVYAYRPSRRG